HHCPRRRESSSDPRRPHFDALADLATELTQHLVTITLLNDALDATVETVAILLSQIFCGDDHHWDVLPVGASTQLVHELEPIHRRHQQVENDQVGLRGGEGIDGYPAVLRLCHLPPDRLERLPYAAADQLVVVDQKYVSRGNATNVPQRLHELGTIDRFHQVVRH